MGSNEYRIGRGVREVFEEVLNARQALVISPWIQGPYAQALLKMVMEGRARVITSMDKENTFYVLLGSLGMYNTSLIVGIGLVFFAIPFFVLSIIMLLNTGLASLGLAGLLLSLVFLAPGVYYILKYLRRRRMLREKPWLANIRLSPPIGQDGFIHIKLYIADDRAWVGSANMTVSAWKHNIEVLAPIDAGAARQIFEWAWQRASPLS